MKLLQILIVTALFFYGCSQAAKENTKAEPANAATIVNTPAAEPVKETESQDINKPVEASAAVALNPAHGMPGHRCDIQVGQPLNSLPATTAQPDMGPINTNQPPATTLPALPVSGKINPPHGQPGHDCAVAVGAPLKN